MSSVERPSGVACENRTLEGVCGGARESRVWARGSTKREPYPITLGVIEVIHVVSGSTNTAGMRFSTMASIGDFSEDQPPTKRTKGQLEPIAFDDEDLEGTIQPHDDALMIAAQISGFFVKRVMIDQGSGVEVMYSDLFKGLGLKNQDLIKYDSPLVFLTGG